MRKIALILALVLTSGCSSFVKSEITEELARAHALATEDALEFFLEANGVQTDFPRLFDTEAELSKRIKEARQVIEVMQSQNASTGFLAQMQFYLNRMLTTAPMENN